MGGKKPLSFFGAGRSLSPFSNKRKTISFSPLSKRTSLQSFISPRSPQKHKVNSFMKTRASPAKSSFLKHKPYFGHKQQRPAFLSPKPFEHTPHFAGQQPFSPKEEMQKYSYLSKKQKYETQASRAFTQRTGLPTGSPTRGLVKGVEWGASSAKKGLGKGTKWGAKKVGQKYGEWKEKIKIEKAYAKPPTPSPLEIKRQVVESEAAQKTVQEAKLAAQFVKDRAAIAAQGTTEKATKAATVVKETAVNVGSTAKEKASSAIQTVKETIPIGGAS